jgi:DNA-binding NarL/FixJ family response regulator
MTTKAFATFYLFLFSLNCFSKPHDHYDLQSDPEERLIHYLSNHNDTALKPDTIIGNPKLWHQPFELLLHNFLEHERLFANKKEKEAKIGFLSDINLVRSKGYYKLEWFLNYRLGRLLYDHENISEGVEYMLYAKSIIPKNDIIIDPALGSFNFFLGQIYCDYYDFETGLKYLKLSLKNGFYNDWDRYLANANTALAYYRLGNPDSCVYYNQIAVKLCGALNMPAELASVSGNLGCAYMEQGNYEKAYEYLSLDYKESYRFKEWESAFAALMKIQEIFYLKKDLKSLEQSFVQLEKIKKQWGTISLMVLSEYHIRKAELYRLKKDYLKVAEQMDSSYYFREEKRKKWNAASLKSLELKVAKNIHEAKIRELQSEENLHSLILMMFIGAFMLSGIIVLMYLKLLKRKRRVQQLIYNHNISIAEQRLQAYLDNIKHNDITIEMLQLELEKIQFTQTDKTNEVEKLKILEKIKESSLVTDEGWKQFTTLVEAVHENFFTNLKIRFPDLTPGESRILTLVKLKISTKEMSLMLGISPDSVKKARQRLRKKLEVPEEIDLYDYTK